MALFNRKTVQQVIEEAYELYEEGKKDEASKIWKKYAEEGYILAMLYYAEYLIDEFEFKEALQWAFEVKSGDDSQEVQEYADELIENCVSRIKGLFAEGEKFYNEGNYIAAMRWYKAAADNEHVGAQYNLAKMHHKGDGVGSDINYEEAFKWYKAAAEHGHVDAQFSLAEMYHMGEGIEANPEEAIKWYKLAAEQGKIEAQSMLKVLL